MKGPPRSSQTLAYITMAQTKLQLTFGLCTVTTCSAVKNLRGATPTWSCHYLHTTYLPSRIGSIGTWRRLVWLLYKEKESVVWRVVYFLREGASPRPTGVLLSYPEFLSHGPNKGERKPVFILRKSILRSPNEWHGSHPCALRRYWLHRRSGKVARLAVKRLSFCGRRSFPAGW